MNKSFMKKNGKRLIKAAGKNILKSFNKNSEQMGQNSKIMGQFLGATSRVVFGANGENYEKLQPGQNFLRNSNNFQDLVRGLEQNIKLFGKTKQHVVRDFSCVPEVQEQAQNQLCGVGAKRVHNRFKNINRNRGKKRREKKIEKGGERGQHKH